MNIQNNMKLLGLIFFLFPVVLISQNQQQLQILGKIQNEHLPVQDVIITNISTGEFSESNDNGEFKIKGSAGDTLNFSHIAFSSFNEKLTDVILALEVLNIQVSDKVNTLDEVTVNAFPNINAVSLRFVDHKAVELTPNERRLQTAGDFKPIHLLAILGGSLPLDPILNKISGRTDKLKKLVKFDQDEDYFDFIIDNQSDFIKTTLNISKEEFNRFIYVLVDNAEIKKAIETNNNTQLQFFIQDLALQFKDKQRIEK